MKVTLYLDNQNIYFYTRIKQIRQIATIRKAWISQMISTIAALENQGDKVESYLETDSSEDRSTYQGRSHLHRHSHR